MEAVPLPQAAPLPARASASASAHAHAPDDWDWVYEDPDLAPFRASRKARPETPLTAWM